MKDLTVPDTSHWTLLDHICWCQCHTEYVTSTTFKLVLMNINNTYRILGPNSENGWFTRRRKLALSLHIFIDNISLCLGIAIPASQGKHMFYNLAMQRWLLAKWWIWCDFDWTLIITISTLCSSFSVSPHNVWCFPTSVPDTTMPILYSPDGMALPPNHIVLCWQVVVDVLYQVGDIFLCF